MIIDEKLIENGITAQLISKLIGQHEVNVSKFSKLRAYYNGSHEILNRKRIADGAANNKIVCNHAKYITDMVQAFLTGNPITYAASKEYDIEPLKNAYLEQDIARVDSELVKNMSIYGRAYELIYADEKSCPRSARLNPENAFVCYSQSAVKTPLIAVHYYNKYDIDNMCTGIVCNVYDNSFVYSFEANHNSISALEYKGARAHYFFGVPVIEYCNNEECQGDFEQLIPLIDAYNTLMSDRVNDKEQFVDAFLFLRGILVDSDQAKKLKAEKILETDLPDGDAKYLSKIMTESDIKVLRDDIKDDIHRFSMVPDLSDESFGNNLSGVAIKYKLLGFEQAIKNKETYFRAALKKRFVLYNNFLTALSRMKETPVHRVDIVFTYNLPANELEIAQMINYLKDLVSNETLLDCLPFVGDAREEAKLVEEEKIREYKRKIEEIEDVAAGGGY